MRHLSDDGRYVIGAQLGRGGQARVHRGRQLDLDREVAIKLLGDGQALREEARLLAALRHPNVVTVLEVVAVDGQPALVLELVEGPTLNELLDDLFLYLRHLHILWNHRRGDYGPLHDLFFVGDFRNCVWFGFR